MRIKSVSFMFSLLIILLLPLYLMAQINPLPSLLATKEEVNRFFTAYMDRYNQKDIPGFFSFFSSQAVQNQKDGLDVMRTNYTKFFNQSMVLRYQIEDMKMEIYQNAVEVKARYQIDQILNKGEKKRLWRGNIRWVLGKEDGVLKIISLDYQHQKSP